MKATRPKLVDPIVKRTVRAPGRNAEYRTQEHLTEAQIEKLLAALKADRHGHRDWLMGLICYRHGLRVSELCDLRWNDIDFPKRTIQIRRLKGFGGTGPKRGFRSPSETGCRTRLELLLQLDYLIRRIMRSRRLDLIRSRQVGS